MSAAMDTNTSTIYIPLLDEGTPVIRPTRAQSLGGDVYRVLATPDYDPEDERWQFPPGSVVRCIVEKRDGREILVARNLVSPAAEIAMEEGSLSVALPKPSHSQYTTL